MTSEATLLELLERIGAQCGKAVFISNYELNQWSENAVTAMKSCNLMVKAHPAISVECIGCENSCMRPVIFADQFCAQSAFVLCDKRDDTNRILIPISHIEQWQASGCSVANLLSNMLNLSPPTENKASPFSWRIGVLKGTKHSSHIVLTTNDKLKLILLIAGHTIELDELLTLDNGGFKIDRRKLNRLIDNPIAGAGDAESAKQRRERLKKRVITEKNKGNKKFLKTVAEEEGISVTRIKQLMQ
jgi:hypothetical protein